jgi:hypothetical protein
MQAGKGGTIGRLLAAAPRPLRLHGDFGIAQALIGAGLSAAATMPLLFLLSLQLQLAVAVPTVLAAGYFVIAQALAARAGRQAGLWSVLIFGGLIAWTLYFSGAASPSVPHAALALIGPLFAAAPSLALRVMAPAEIRPATGMAETQEADAAEILLDREGRVVAANAGARRLLEGRQFSTGMDAARLVPLFERPAFLDAVRACRQGGERRLTIGAERRTLEASLQASRKGLIMRLHPTSHEGIVGDSPPKAENRAQIMPAAAPAWWQHADVADAISAACREVSPRAVARRVRLINRSGEAMAAAVEAPKLKDILVFFLAAATEESAREGRIEIACREQRGAVVVRAAGSPAEAVMARDMVQEAARHADAAGGSVIFRREADESFVLELRLPAVHPPRNVTQEDVREGKGCSR